MRALLVCFVLLAGCATVSYDPETGAVNYTRIGNQHIDGFVVEKNGDNVKVSLDGADSETEMFEKLLKAYSTAR